MSKSKIKITLSEASQFIESIYACCVSNITEIQGGAVSQSFSFFDQNQAYIIRFNYRDLGFYKDDYAARHFSSETVPIPQVIKIGKYQEHFYCLSEKAPGATLDTFSNTGEQALLPCTLKTLKTIHSIKVAPEAGYSYLDRFGQGECKTWQSHLLDKIENPYYSWEEKIKQGLMDEDTFRKAKETILNLLQYLPESCQHILHGDYGSDNLLIHENKVSAVIDWNNSLIGDWVFDIAYLEYWNPEIGYIVKARELYEDTNFSLKHFNHRAFCYLVIHGLAITGFFIHNEQRDRYDTEIKKLQRILSGISAFNIDNF